MRVSLLVSQINHIPDTLPEISEPKELAVKFKRITVLYFVLFLQELDHSILGYFDH